MLKGCIEVDRIELLKQLDIVADTIGAGEPSRTWPCWVTYILEVLEENTDRESYTDFLKRLRFAITTRLESGEW